jgi:putative transposase
MIESHGKLSQTRQCQLLDLARSTYYYQPQPITSTDLVLLHMMDEQYLKTLQYGSRSYATWFQSQGMMLERKKASSLMKSLGIVSIAQKPRAYTLLSICTYLFILYFSIFF